MSSLFGSKTSSAPAPKAVMTQQVASQSQPDELTMEQVKSALPTHLRSTVTQNLVDTINNIAADPLMAENIRNNFVSYSVILKEGKFKTEDYLTAVTYVSYKLMGYSNQDAWVRTFPQRHHLLVSKGSSAKDISAHVASYNRGKLVNMILEQTLVPSWVLNQDLYQKAINVQADLMINSQSDKVKQEAANSLLVHIAKPKESNIQLNIGEAESNSMREMREAISKLARTQKELIDSGDIHTIDVAASRIGKPKDE